MEASAHLSRQSRRFGKSFGHGQIDDVRIYDRALSAVEVAALYQLENTPPDQNATVTGTVHYDGVIPGPTYVWALEANGSKAAEYVLPDGNGTYSLTVPKGRGYDFKVFVDGSQNGYPTNGEVWKHYGDWNSSLGGFNLIQVDGNLSSIDFTLADEDSDGDGFVNWHEHQAGTGINDANSTPGLDFGLVAYYPFAGNASDMSGQWKPWHAAERGRPWLPIGTVVTGQAYSFDGVDDLIDVGASAFPDIGKPNQPATFTGWFKTSQNVVDAKVILSDYNSATGLDNHLVASIYVRSDRLQTQSRYQGSAQVDSNAAGLADGQWHFFAYQMDGASKLKVYLDGAFDSESAYDPANDFRDNTHWRIGASFMDGSMGSFFDGSIDEIRIYDRALSANEVTALYQLENTAPNQPPVFAENNATFTTFENNATASFVVTATDPDANTTLVYSSSGPDADKFDLNASTGILTFTNTPDFEANASTAGTNAYYLTITVTDGEANATQSLTVNVTNMVEDFDGDGVEDHFDTDDDNDGFSDTAEIAYGSDPRNATSLANQAPTAIDLNGTTIAENQPVGTVLGEFNTTDPDANATHVFTLVEGNGSTHNNFFTLDANGTLRTLVSLDHEANATLSIRVKATDEHQAAMERNFTVTVTDEPDIAYDALTLQGTLQTLSNSGSSEAMVVSAPSGDLVISSALLIPSGLNVTFWTTGDLFVNKPITISGSETLVLHAGRSIYVNENITSSNPTGKLSLNMGWDSPRTSFSMTTSSTRPST